MSALPDDQRVVRLVACHAVRPSSSALGSCLLRAHTGFCDRVVWVVALRSKCHATSVSDDNPRFSDLVHYITTSQKGFDAHAH